MPYVNDYPEHNFAVFARDARDTLTPNATQRTTLIVAACYIVAIAILWCVLLLVVEGLGRVFIPCFLRVRRHLPYVSVISESPDLSVEATAC